VSQELWQAIEPYQDVGFDENYLSFIGGMAAKEVFVGTWALFITWNFR
jgi:hypothetical protein